MMTISNVNLESKTFMTNQKFVNDSYSITIQKQIESKQKELQELSKLEDMSVEDKMKRRQKIMKEIADLYNQLRQHQIEERMKRQQQMSSSKGDKAKESKGRQKGHKQNNRTGMSKASMTALISADTSMKQAHVQGKAAAEMEGRAGVLEAEIKLDKERGVNTEKKEAELSDIKDKVNSTVSSIMSTLSDAIDRMKEAGEEDQENEKASENKKETDEQKASSAGKTDDLEKQGEIRNEQVNESDTAAEAATSDEATGKATGADGKTAVSRTNKNSTINVLV